MADDNAAARAAAKTAFQQAAQKPQQTRSLSIEWGPSPLQNMLLGFGLVGLNVITQTDFGTLFKRIWNAPASAKDVQKGTFTPQSLLTIGGEVVFVLGLSFISGFSPVLARGVLFFWLGLYLVWLVFNGQKLGLIGASLHALTPQQPLGQQINNAGKKA